MFLKSKLTEAGYEHGSSKSDLFVREKRSWSLKGSTAHFRRADARTILTYIFIYLSFPGALIFNTNFTPWFKELSWKQESSSSDERTSKSDDNASNFSPPQKYWCFLNKERSCFERHYDDFSSRIALMMMLLLLLDFFWKRKTQKTTALILLVVAQSGTFKSVRTEKKTYIALSAPGNKARMYSDLTRATYRPEIITKLAAFFAEGFVRSLSRSKMNPLLDWTILFCLL